MKSLIYQSAEVETNCGEITRQHSEKVKTVSKPVNITTQSLLSISISNFGLKHRNLIEAHISPLPNLYIFVMGNIPFT